MGDTASASGAVGRAVPVRPQPFHGAGIGSSTHDHPYPEPQSLSKGLRQTPVWPPGCPQPGTAASPRFPEREAHGWRCPAQNPWIRQFPIPVPASRGETTPLPSRRIHPCLQIPAVGVCTHPSPFPPREEFVVPWETAARSLQRDPARPGVGNLGQALL